MKINLKLVLKVGFLVGEKSNEILKKKACKSFYKGVLSLVISTPVGEGRY